MFALFCWKKKNYDKNVIPSIEWIYNWTRHALKGSPRSQQWANNVDHNLNKKDININLSLKEFRLSYSFKSFACLGRNKKRITNINLVDFIYYGFSRTTEVQSHCHIPPTVKEREVEYWRYRKCYLGDKCTCPGLCITSTTKRTVPAGPCNML